MSYTLLNLSYYSVHTRGAPNFQIFLCKFSITESLLIAKLLLRSFKFVLKVDTDKTIVLFGSWCRLQLASWLTSRANATKPLVHLTALMLLKLEAEIARGCTEAWARLSSYTSRVKIVAPRVPSAERNPVPSFFFYTCPPFTSPSAEFFSFAGLEWA